MQRLIDWAERGWLPDVLLRFGIRKLLKERLRAEARGGCEAQLERLYNAAEAGPGGTLAVETDAANRQHYELPPAFFRRVLGPRMKYSGCLWRPGAEDLAAAEEAMLALTAERAALGEGQDVLDLGCGWGSLSLWLGEKFPTSRILAVSNARSQGEWIAGECRRRGLRNVEVAVANVNDFRPKRTFDRVVSVEMFEHVRNHRELLRRTAEWLRPDGVLLVHVFCHRNFAYPFEAEGEVDWMARHFFTGGFMPSDDLLLRFQEDLILERQWRVDGRHYQRTALAWLARFDASRQEIQDLFEEVYGAREARRWLGRWRLFFLACAELFGYRGGQEWWVAHYRFRRRRSFLGGSDLPAA